MDASDELENCLKCGICKNFFDSPLSFSTAGSCHHSFCSLCIRKWFNLGNVCCPSCRHSVSLVDALPNLSLGVVVNAYLNKTNNNNSNGEKKPVNLLGGSIKFQRLPLIAYDLLGDEKLIELVRQVGFNTNGYSREFLITLHSEYTEQYNAKIDSGVRETPNGEEIRKNVLASNRLLSSKKSTPPSSSVSSFFSSSLVTANKRNLASSETGGNSTLAVKEIRKRRKIEQSQWTWQRTSNEWRAVWSDKLNGILYWNDKTNEVTTEKPPREKDEENNNKHDDAARYIVIINDDDDLTQ